MAGQLIGWLGTGMYRSPLPVGLNHKITYSVIISLVH